jgi:prolipoprotein diacylglyceryltransferase
MMQTILFYLIFIFYLVMAYCFLTTWLNFFREDDKMTSEQRILSSIILVLGTVFWPVVVPFAYLELLKSNQKKKQSLDLSIDLSIIDEECHTRICDR